MNNSQNDQPTKPLSEQVLRIDIYDAENKQYETYEDEAAQKLILALETANAKLTEALREAHRWMSTKVELSGNANEHFAQLDELRRRKEDFLKRLRNLIGEDDG